MMSIFNRTRLIAKTPVFQQIHAAECAAACLGIILAHFGRWVSMNDLRPLCAISREGASAADIKRAANHYGLELTGWRKSPKALETIKSPIIIFWDFHHFLVLEGFRNNRFYLNDPANGHRSVDYETFRASFTGIALFLEPCADFQRSESKPTLRTRLLPWFENQKHSIAIAAILGLGMTIPGIAVPILLGMFVDRVLVAGESIGLMLGFIVCVLTLLMFSMIWIQQRCLIRLSLRVAVTQAGTFLKTLLSLPIEFFSQRFPGEVAARTQLIDAISDTSAIQLTKLIIEMTMSVIFLMWLVWKDPILASLVLCIAITCFVALKITTNFRIYENFRLVREQGQLLGIGAMGLQNLETIRSTGSEDDFFNRFTGYQARELISRQRFSEFGALFTGLPSFFLMLGNVVVLAVGSWRVLQASLTIGELMAFYVIVGNFLLPLGRYVEASSLIQILEANLQRVEDVLSAKSPHEVQVQNNRDTSGVTTLDGRIRLSGHLEIRNVSYGYREYHDPIIRDFNLKIEPGQRVAIVGPNGSGKSTLALLIAGIYKPWSGEILFDGKPREMIPREVFAESVSYVDQHVILFSSTVWNNLSMWNTQIPEELVVAATKDSFIHEDIVKRRGGYSTLVEEGGANFSGGQRQRLEIARALVNSPSILVMDEATSDLDATLEAQIDDSIRRRGCACLIIAHRLSTIRDCDEIIVMDKGTIIQRGNNDELLQDRNGLYREMVTSH